MIIAVNNRITRSSQGVGYGQVMETTCIALAEQFPQHRFLFIYDRPYTPEISLPENVRVIVAGPETGSKLRLQYWLNYKLPGLLKKHNADLLINTDGCCSLRTKKPQCMLVNDLSFLEDPQGMKRSIARFYKKNMTSFLSKAAIVAAGSTYTRAALAEKYELDSNSIELLRPGVDDAFKPYNWEEAEAIREKYTEGRSYFLCSGQLDTGNLVNLLKAFTFFKKRQKSSMLLVIAAEVPVAFRKAFSTYKLRHEVKILEKLSTPELAAITGSAYAVVYPVGYDNIAMPVLQGMRSAVPAITASIPALMTEFAAAALFVNPEDPAELAENMMLLFKDEDQAKKLVASGLVLIKQYEAAGTAQKLMHCINKAINA